METVQKYSTEQNSTRAKVLDEAKKCVCTDRDSQYGEPEDSFAVISKLWSVYLAEPVSPTDVAVMMALLKIARIKTGKYKMDNAVDGAGYLACYAELAEKEECKI